MTKNNTNSDHGARHSAYVFSALGLLFAALCAPAQADITLGKVGANFGAVHAQLPAPLPAKLSGNWSSVVPGGRAYTDTMSIVLDPPDQAGRVTGRFTSRGVACGALDEPLTGSWNGSELRFESQVRPSVNTQRLGGDCGDGRIRFVLVRKPGQSGFEGQSVREGAPAPAQITLSP